MKKIFSILDNINKLFEQDTVLDDLDLKSDFKIIDFVEAAPSTTVGGMKIIFLSAIVDISYNGRQGVIPINNIVTDWVKKNEVKMSPVLWERLREYVENKFPAWSGKGMVKKYKETHESPINQEQTEFFPEFQEDNNLRIMIDAEIILEK